MGKEVVPNAVDPAVRAGRRTNSPLICVEFDKGAFRVEDVVCRALQIMRVAVTGGNAVVRVYQTGEQHSGIEHTPDGIRLNKFFWRREKFRAFEIGESVFESLLIFGNPTQCGTLSGVYANFLAIKHICQETFQIFVFP